jgi:hypothetical protein
MDNAANGVRIGRVPHTVYDDLRHRALAVIGLVGSFVVDGIAQAFQRTRIIGCAGCEQERAGRATGDDAVSGRGRAIEL